MHTLMLACYLLLAILLIIVILLQPAIGLSFRPRNDNKVRGRSNPMIKITYMIAIACAICCIWLSRYDLQHAQENIRATYTHYDEQ